MLVYLDKRIHLKNRTYEMKRDLAILDWNEHVDRPFTSRCTKQWVQNCRRNLGNKRNKKKSYTFVRALWCLLVDVLSNSDEGSGNCSDEVTSGDDSSDTDFLYKQAYDYIVWHVWSVYRYMNMYYTTIRMTYAPWEDSDRIRMSICPVIRCCMHFLSKEPDPIIFVRTAKTDVTEQLHMIPG